MNTTSVGDVGKMHKDSPQNLQIWFDYLYFSKVVVVRSQLSKENLDLACKMPRQLILDVLFSPHDYDDDDLALLPLFKYATPLALSTHQLHGTTKRDEIEFWDELIYFPPPKSYFSTHMSQNFRLAIFPPRSRSFEWKSFSDFHSAWRSLRLSLHIYFGNDSFRWIFILCLFS